MRIGPDVPAGSGAIAPSLHVSGVGGGLYRVLGHLDDLLMTERDRWFAWGVVALASGISVYFGLKAEPSTIMTVGVASLSLGFFALFRRVPSLTLRFLIAALAAMAVGFTAAKLRASLVEAPVIARDIGPLMIEGRIASVLPEDSKRVRIVLEPIRIGDATERLPRFVRLTLRGEKAVAAAKPGLWVSQFAFLRPPPEPSVPRGYDFARDAYFQQLGGVGFGLGAPKPIMAPRSETWREWFALKVESLRLAMTARIRSVVPGSDGAIAAALVTGVRGGIPEEDNEAYRDSGLSHVLSISGLHMALAGFGLFFAVRALLALWPRVALTQPIKKWAAFAALLSSTFYLFISGGGAAPVRSYIMLSAMLLAILCDRPALSMRSVGSAALAILLVAPESVIMPGFQMSFAAVIGLIALAEWDASREKSDLPSPFGFFVLWRKVKRSVSGVALTTLIAGAATAPFAIYHFNRAAGYSLLANLLAFPVVGVLVMPAAAIGVILMPLGLDGWAFTLMGWGVRAMSEIARFVASLPGAASLVPSWSLSALLLIVGGFLWVTLWQRRWRWFGMLPIAFGLIVGMRTVPPDVLIARDGSSAAVRGSEGSLLLLGNPDDYTAEQWLKRDGDGRTPDEARGLARCDEEGCTVARADGRVVALSLRAGALPEDCTRADIVVSAVPIRRDCTKPARVIDRFQIARDGATALWLSGEDIKIQTARETRGIRPWTNPVLSSAE